MTWGDRRAPAFKGTIAPSNPLSCVWPEDDFDHLVGLLLPSLVGDNDDLISIADWAEIFGDD